VGLRKHPEHVRCTIAPTLPSRAAHDAAAATATWTTTPTCCGRRRLLRVSAWAKRWRGATAPACCRRRHHSLRAQGMPVVVAAEDVTEGPCAVAAGVGEAVNLGVARTKGETKEEKKARKEAVKQQVVAPPLLLSSSHSFHQRSANRAAKKQLKDACDSPSTTINASLLLLPTPPPPHTLPYLLTCRCSYTGETIRRAPVGAKQSVLPV
jgi:hypothetical protein